MWLEKGEMGGDGNGYRLEVWEGDGDSGMGELTPQVGTAETAALQAV